ncbi:unnamed protein product [Chondrus crispus]|uniref:Uncharacterized protein n=1 Tax=Chondrus crispus TaxID=2769 RepID=R7QP10_CHOCR|nr:unnamed protein product [Chondrus crispus]CDF39488.1 unnamed protein product [Chondrus crispus]|eukprot:XP_005719399.1 unnamed protein product [Chondrus crispus]
MQPYSPPITRSYVDSPQLKSRTYVQLFAWFGLLIAVLHLFEGRSLGWLQLFLSILGIFASWENVTSRRSYLAVYVAGCFIWTVIDAFYMLLLIASIWSPLHDFIQGLIVSNTFRNLSGSLDELFTALGKDTGFFELFSVTTSLLRTFACRC